ncbi:MAG: serine--tRNA ligase [Bdellovibrionota bacterium]
MLDYSFIEKNRDRIEKSLKARGDGFDLAEIEKLAKRRKELQLDHDNKKAHLNTLSKEIGDLMRTDKVKAEAKKQETTALKAEVHQLTQEFEAIDAVIKEKLLLLPNAIHESVVIGTSEKDNPEIRTWSTPKSIPNAKDHDVLAHALGILDVERSAKVSGARFSYLKGMGASLERALVNFMLDTHRQAGYQEISTPYLVNATAMTGTGQLPKFHEDAFRITDPELYLIPTAEVSVTNYHREEIMDEKELTKSFVCYSPCFRREAGSYGKDTKGLIRQHQFHKVELVKFTKPEDSYSELEKLTSDAERILQLLELPYRVIALCSGDIGFGSAKTYDIEVWLPGQKTYREISSCSNFEDFQARRAGIRFKGANMKKPEFAHTLNGSGLAVGRTWLAILENYQQPDGSIAVPKVLQKYLGVDKIG